MKLLSIMGNAKTQKNIGYLSAELNLAPTTTSGYNTCPNATDGCANACIGWFSGRNVMSVPRQAKIRKTKDFFENRQLFMLNLAKELNKLIVKGIKDKLPICVRLNCYSDIPWENIKIDFDNKGKKNLFELFPSIQFYDYTKNEKRFNPKLPDNYHLTFSRSEKNERDALLLLGRGHNVAFVFNEVPDIYRGFKVIDGDETDLRFLDKPGVIVGLKAKGGGKKDKSGFVI